MHAMKLQAETVISINTNKDLDEISNLKLDLQLYKLAGQERLTKIEPETQKVKLRVKSISVSQLGKSESKINKVESKTECKLRARVDTKPESKPETKAEIKAEGQNSFMPDVPTVAVKVSSVIAKAAIRPR
ncbi:MAG: hypothetical protein PHP51_00515 [Desulfotomaculaceae bacterium]|nr:hypothetical protein [Desulfotomaculaceae bacterium]MDD4766056.1 hypothetical protein [Desulfotomaculaceae bacterium]